MSHLLREHAPITEEGWGLIDDEARERLTPGLAARRVVDFSGPHGWQHSAANLGRVADVAAPDGDRLAAKRREVLPLAELRADFSVSRAELRDGDRGAEDVDFADLDDAAVELAVAENRAVFNGWPEAGIDGITTACSHDPIAKPKDLEKFPAAIAAATDALMRAGIDGPYAIALGNGDYRHVIETTEHGGYPLFQHLREIADGPLVWTPGIEGAVVVSLRGGDFRFESGQDISVGYDSDDAESVSLYLEESSTFRVLTPEAAVAIR
jgi:uncharacterized linocin/CFP29 family protein